MTYRAALRVRVLPPIARIRRIAVAASGIIGAAVAASGAGAAEDARDLTVIMPAVNDALEYERSGKEIAWSNVATGRGGMIRVERTFYRGQQPCRDYVRTTVGSGPGYQIRGIGCRLGKLNWTVEEARVDEPAATAAAPAALPAPAAPDPNPAVAKDAAGRSGDPSGEPASPRPLRKQAAPPAPTLRYGLPTRSAL
jgi:surface antigen